VAVAVEVEKVDAENGQLTSTATVEDERGVAATGRMRHAVVEREAFAEQVRRRVEDEYCRSLATSRDDTAETEGLRFRKRPPASSPPSATRVGEPSPNSKTPTAGQLAL
jgi:hypothetical protein